MQGSMKRHNNPKLTKKKPTNLTHHKPSPPTVIWSNSAYAAAADDGRSSVASNEISAEHDRRRRFDDLICEEEVRLREELGREIERELERELMDGILVLVRRLSDLKAKQFLRELGDARRNFWRDDGLMRKSFFHKNGVEKKDLGEGEMNRRRGFSGDRMLGGRDSDAASRTSEVKHRRERRRKEGF